MKFDLDDLAKKTDDTTNGNTYRIVEINIAHQCYLIECENYYGPEDLGDGIMLYGSGQQVWVASYAFDWMTQKL